MICGAHAPKCNHAEPPPSAAPPPMCPPRFCSNHDTSDKRVKCEPCAKSCKKCGVSIQSSYKDFQLCPHCSEADQKCMICGCSAPKSSSYMPGAHPSQSNGHASTSKQGGVPPPPPPPPPGRQPWDTDRHPQGDSRPMCSPNHQSPAANSHYDNGQVFSTRLPTQGQQRLASRSQPPQGMPTWDNNRGGRPQMQNPRLPKDGQESFSGFLRFVAADIWKTCNTDTRSRLDSPERQYVRRGGA